MTVDLKGPERRGILLRVEQRAVVVRPGDVAGHVGNDVGEDFPGLEILELNRADPSPDGIDGVGQDVLGRADDGALDGVELISRRHHVDIEDDLFQAI